MVTDTGMFSSEFAVKACKKAKNFIYTPPEGVGKAPVKCFTSIGELSFSEMYVVMYPQSRQ
ncbi:MULTISPECIES: hypothetical protein [unclassified Methanosarcina]|uniref:hypothetical protein n=1 Tax=unclassified Methanosarcina TaxID=2644672 RepID=UPI00064E2C98|nr:MULTISPECIES: hypothetical protein [unclassified Methanosarcina]